jgi:prepilin signal peptidase PulO-like enzyme (type II secretory pathway)
MSAAELEVILAVAKREKRREQIERRAKAGAALAFVIVLFIGFVVAMLDVLVWRA